MVPGLLFLRPMKVPATLTQILTQEFSDGSVTFDHNQKIATAAIIVDRTFQAAGNEQNRRYWSKADRQNYAKQVQQVMAKDSYLSGRAA
jgi:hypothetical protein